MKSASTGFLIIVYTQLLGSVLAFILRKEVKGVKEVNEKCSNFKKNRWVLYMF